MSRPTDEMQALGQTSMVTDAPLSPDPAVPKIPERVLQEGTDGPVLPPEETQQTEQPEEKNPFLDDLIQLERDRIDKLSASLYLGVQKNPESMADIYRIAKETGYPLEIVERNKDQIEREAKFRAINIKDMVEYTPEVARFLSRPENAALAHEDIKTLMAAETAFSDLGKGPLGTAASRFVRDASQAVSTIGYYAASRKSKRAMEALKLFDQIDAGTITDEALLPTEAPVAPFVATPDELTFTPAAPLAHQYLKATPDERAKLRRQLMADLDPREQESYQIAKKIDDWVKEQFKTNPLYEQAFLTGTLPGAFGSMFSFLVVNMLTRNPAITGTLAAVQEGGFQMLDALEHGATIEQAINTADWNFWTGYTEVIPIARFLDRVDKAAGGTFKKALIDVLKSGTEESLQEMFQTLWENLTASKLVGYDPERGLLVGTGEAGAAAFTVGAVTQTILNLLFGRHGRARSPSKETNNPNTLEQDKIDEFNEVGRQAKLAQRAPETFKDFLAQVQETYGADEPIYIPAQHLQELVDQGVLKRGENATVDAMLDQLEEALPTGADVVVPVSDYITDVASNEQLAQVMREIVRLSPDSLSIREAREIQPEAPERLMKQLEVARQNAEIKAEVDDIVNRIRDDLIATNVVAPHVARINAKILSSWVTSFAQRNNMTPMQVFEKMGLKVKGPELPDVIPPPVYAPEQNLEGIRLQEEHVVEETGERVVIEQPAAELWQKAQEDRTKIEQLIRCLYG
ncbi:MAG: hypothetical protein D6698_15605 [Gammaproteobacteria bacterium]|nr:MAG: hypothetical protein D6698_15605 [Gammaproteobacteria bacterium]